MRGLETPVRYIRRKVFEEVARVGFESTPETLIESIEIGRASCRERVSSPV